VSAGVTAGLGYAFSAIPLQISAAEKLHLSPAVASSWFFVIWLTGAMASIPLTLRYRQPLAITWTIPAWFSSPAPAAASRPGSSQGASLVAGVLIVALGLLGVGARLMRWLPFPIVMGMFAGSIFGCVTGIFEQLDLHQVSSELQLQAISEPGRSAARGCRRWPARSFWDSRAQGSRVKHPEAMRWSASHVEPVAPVLGSGGVLALSVPLVVMAIGIGTTRGSACS